MRWCKIMWIVAVALTGTLLGCGGSAKKELSQNQTMLFIKPVNGYVKKVAMVQMPLPVAEFDRNAGNLFFQTLATTLRKESDDLNLRTAEGEGFPEFMAALPRSGRAINAATLALAGRQNGYNGLIIAALHNMRSVAYKSGMFWFRKTRYRLIFEVSLDIYDPYTGAKILSAQETDSIKIDEVLYGDYQEGLVTRLEDLDEALVDMGEEIGELAAEILAAQPWQISVVKVDGNRIFLPAGRQAGLQAGQRLAVLEGRRMIEGSQGQKFIMPGPNVGEVVITQVSQETAEAKTDAAGKIRAGDIAIPIR